MTDLICEPGRRRHHAPSRPGAGGLVITRTVGQALELRTPTGTTTVSVLAVRPLAHLRVEPNSIPCNWTAENRITIKIGDTTATVQVVGRSKLTLWLRIVAPRSVEIVRAELAQDWKGNPTK